MPQDSCMLSCIWRVSLLVIIINIMSSISNLLCFCYPLPQGIGKTTLITRFMEKLKRSHPHLVMRGFYTCKFSLKCFFSFILFHPLILAMYFEFGNGFPVIFFPFWMAFHLSLIFHWSFWSLLSFWMVIHWSLPCIAAYLLQVK